MMSMLAYYLGHEAPDHIKTLEITFPIVGHSFLPPDRVFGLIERILKKQCVIINRREYEDIIAKFSTVLKLDEDWNIFDWKTVATDIVKKPAQWHFKFNECKRFIFTKQSNNNLRSKNVTVRGEVLYRSDLCSENTIIKKGKSLSALRPNSVVTGNCLKGNKSSIADVLGKHYGPDWRQNPDLEFYATVDRARAGEPLHVLEKGYDWRAEGDVHLELATKNEATRSLGVVYVDIVIGDITYPRTRFFVVPDLRDDVILGHEWLEAVKATLCYAQQCVAPPLIGRGPWRRCDSTWIAAPCPSYSQRVYSTSSPRLTTPASWTLYALRNLPRQKTASVTFRKNINMYVTPEKIKDALRALPPTIIGHSPESWSVEEPEKTYPAIKLICNRVIHESEIQTLWANRAVQKEIYLLRSSDDVPEMWTGVGGLRSPTFELGEQTAPRSSDKAKLRQIIWLRVDLAMACGRGRGWGLRADMCRPRKVDGVRVFGS
ncbi:hypothetical protein MTP99_002959 [Tenebrio molitor]|nr:hypothetical protein MTP99_002959 [Tenebrio molitor]